MLLGPFIGTFLVLVESKSPPEKDVERESFLKTVVFAERYHNHSELTWILNTLQFYYPENAHVYSIGRSVQDRDLLVIALAQEQPQEHVLGRPEVKYVGNIHGDETIGRVLLLRLAGYLLQNTDLLGPLRLHLLISLNPDGFAVSTEGQCSTYPGKGRWNANYKDLNRDFPDPFVETGSLKSRQPETRAVIWWMHELQFLLSISIHGGALVVNYPFDSVATPDSISTAKSIYSRAPDDDVLRHLSHVYANSHPLLNQSKGCPWYDSFENGITNGAAWYPIKGGMQDYSYVFGGAVELTIEASCCKYPSPDRINEMWQQNREPLVKLLGEATRGVKGILTFKTTPLLSSTLRIDMREVPFYATDEGEFWRMLKPGYYWLEVQNHRYSIHAKIRIQVGNSGASTYNITWTSRTQIAVSYCIQSDGIEYCKYQRIGPKRTKGPVVSSSNDAELSGLENSPETEPTEAIPNLPDLPIVEATTTGPQVPKSTMTAVLDLPERLTTVTSVDAVSAEELIEDEDISDEHVLCEERTQTRADVAQNTVVAQDTGVAEEQQTSSFTTAVTGGNFQETTSLQNAHTKMVTTPDLATLIANSSSEQTSRASFGRTEVVSSTTPFLIQKSVDKHNLKNARSAAGKSLGRKKYQFWNIPLPPGSTTTLPITVPNFGGGLPQNVATVHNATSAETADSLVTTFATSLVSPRSSVQGVKVKSGVVRLPEVETAMEVVTSAQKKLGKVNVTEPYLGSLRNESRGFQANLLASTPKLPTASAPNVLTSKREDSRNALVKNTPTARSTIQPTTTPLPPVKTTEFESKLKTKPMKEQLLATLETTESTGFQYSVNENQVVYFSSSEEDFREKSKLKTVQGKIITTLLPQTQDRSKYSKGRAKVLYEEPRIQTVNGANRYCDIFFAFYSCSLVSLMALIFTG